MVRNYFLSGVALLFLCTTFSAPVAEAGMPIRTKVRLDEMLQQEEEARSRGIIENRTVSGFMKLEPGVSMSELEEKGVDIISRIGDILIVEMPLNDAIAIADSKTVQRFELSEEMRPMMYAARPYGDVNGVQAGTGLNQPYDGTGILAGVFDTGLDVSHPNFDGRVEAVYYYYSASEYGPNLRNLNTYFGEDVSKFKTDNKDTTHGTHTLGILGGSGKNIDKYAMVTKIPEIATSGGAQMKIYDTGDSPFYGIATGSNLMVGCAKVLFNDYIIAGVQNLMDYAQEQGKPAVVNISLGGNNGPHDGSPLYVQALSELGTQGVITISAGNEGGDDISISENFSGSSTSLKTFIVPEGSTSSNVAPFNSGTPYVEVWSNNSQQLTVNVLLTDEKGNILSTVPVTSTAQRINLSSTLPNDFSIGTITIQSETDSENNRYNALISGSNITQKSGSKVRLGIEVIGKAGQRADLFASDGCFSDLKLEGWTQPDGNMSINSLACGDNVLVVGAMISNPIVAFLDGTGGYYPSLTNTNDIAYYSSWGTLINNKQLPEIVTPGTSLVSSLSSYYTASFTESDVTSKMASGIVEENGTNYYWGPEQGTSMAAPFAAGVVALWQQASMEKNGRALTIGEVIDLSKNTGIKNEYYKTAEYPVQWGSGIMNAYDGIKEILGTTGIGQITVNGRDDENSLLFELLGRNLNVMVSGASAVRIDISSVMGQNVYTRNATNNELNENLEFLTSGIYVITITTPEGKRYTKKINLK